MQNARLSELEKLLAKSSTKPSPVKMSNVARSSEELHQMKEENRMVGRFMFRCLSLLFSFNACTPLINKIMLTMVAILSLLFFLFSSWRRWKSCKNKWTDTRMKFGC